MKKLIPFFLLFSFSNFLNAQVQSISDDVDGSVTILPQGLVSGKSDPTQLHGNVTLGPGTLNNNIGAAGLWGDFNTAIGFKSMNANTYGFRNTAVGYNSLSSNTEGLDNTAMGYFSLLSNILGDSNTAIGSYSLNENTNGKNNTAIGVSSLEKNIGGNTNTASGYYALNSNTSGSANTANGSSSLSENTTGTDNTAIGTSSLVSNTTGKYNTSSGVNSLEGNTVGFYNTGIGYSAMSQNTTGWGNTAIGRSSLVNNVSGSYNTAIGTSSGVTIGAIKQNAIAIGYQAIVNASNKIRMGNTSITAADIQVAWNVTSDRRWKENIERVPLGLDFVNELKPVSYHRKNNEKPDVEFGLIAQEVEQTLAKFGFTERDLGFLDKGPDGYYSVRYNDLISVLISAIQEQQNLLDTQDKSLSQLNAKLDRIEAMLISQNEDLKSKR